MSAHRRRNHPYSALGLALVLTAALCAAAASLAAAQGTTTTPVSSQTQPAEDERLPFMPPERDESAAAAPSAGVLLLRTLGALFLVVGMLVAGAWGLRKLGGAHFGKPAEDAPDLAVLATISLGERRSLTAVRFGERLLLVGSTAQTVTLLASERRAPRNVTPPRMRSVADLLQDDEPRSFEQVLAMERLKNENR